MTNLVFRPPGIEGSQCAFALDPVALAFVADFAANFFFERGKQVEGDVCGVEVPAFGVGDVVDERAEGGFARGGRGLGSAGDGCGVEAG